MTNDTSLVDKTKEAIDSYEADHHRDFNRRIIDLKAKALTEGDLAWDELISAILTLAERLTTASNCRLED